MDTRTFTIRTLAVLLQCLFVLYAYALAIVCCSAVVQTIFAIADLEGPLVIIQQLQTLNFMSAQIFEAFPNVSHPISGFN